MRRDALSRLALYDAVVASALAWRATSTPPIEYRDAAHRAEEAIALEAARRTIHRHGKHIVDERVIRELAAIHARSTP